MLMWLYKNILEPLFFRWKKEIMETGQEKWYRILSFEERIMKNHLSDEYKTGKIPFYKDFVTYKYTNKYDGSVKIKKIYL